MAYSKDLREKVLKYREKHSLEKTHEVYEISVSTIRDWERLKNENGNLNKRPLNRTFKKIDPI
ncbi:MAG: IS630 transposase-related protein, partial [Oscillospiraceae bacterium]|nr:IS630 transposase-related protein [Oscillospiraceae bacterium]